MGKRVIIIGGGVSGLSLGHYLKGTGRFDVTVLESEAIPGGKVSSDKTGGYLCERGVNGFLDNKPSTLDLSRSLMLDPLRSSDAARKRFVYTGGRLHRLPESPLAFLKSGLMSWGGKLRIAMEPFIKTYTGEDESLADFARRRLGKEAYEKLIDPMASGIYAGDPEQMSLKSCFARINELEQTYGSLIKGMISLMRERRKNVSAAPGGTLTSYAGGMQTLTDALAASLGEGAVRLSQSAVSLQRSGDTYTVYLKDGSTIETDIAVLATPAHQSTLILRDLDAGVSRVLDEIPYSSLNIVCTGFKKASVNISVDAFGFLVPFREGRKILGTLFDSSVFTDRAPEDKVLLRSMVGGARGRAYAELDDKNLLETVLSELNVVTGLQAEPDFVKIYRHVKAIPQYNLGHQRRLDKVEEAHARHKGLYITGNAYRGVSVNDCILNSLKLSEQITKEVG